MNGDTQYRFGRSAALHVLACMFVIGALFAHVRPAHAAVDWCSSDPVFTFEHHGLLSTYGLDVQVMVPPEALPLSGPARLEVVTPNNVATNVVNPPNPVFPIVVNVAATATDATAQSYPVKMVLLVPESTSTFPVRLVVSDPQRGTVSIFDGTAGRPLQVKVGVNPPLQ